MFNRTIFIRDERPVANVPKVVKITLVFAFLTQISWYVLLPDIRAQVKALPQTPSAASLRLASLDDPLIASRVVMLWLQAFDNQPGISIPFNELDYDRLIDWLALSLELDPNSQYPLLAASRLYTSIANESKIRKMLEFVHEKFFEAPKKRWTWLAHAIYVAKHRLKDLDLALKYARALRLHTREGDAPHWARHMEVYILQDMDEIEAAKILIGGLLEGGAVTDPNEIRFLEKRLKELKGP